MLLDNKAHGKVGDVLVDAIGKDAQLSILTNLFSVFGFAALQKQLNAAASLRLLLPGDLKPGQAPALFHLAGLAGDESERQFRNALDLSVVARACAECLDRKAEIRAVSSVVPQNLFHIAGASGTATAIQGSSPLTPSGLGIVPSSRFEMNTCFRTSEETAALLGWFDSLWNNAELVRDVKDQVLAQLREIYDNKSPEMIYFLILYGIFRDFLGELDEDKIIKTRTGIKNTLVWNKL